MMLTAFVVVNMVDVRKAGGLSGVDGSGKGKS